MTDKGRVALIEERLRQAFNPFTVDVVDQSHLHAGHEGAKSGGGHFSVTVVAEAFSGKSAIERHRMVYGAMGSLMQTDIHALSIKALAPEEI